MNSEKSDKEKERKGPQSLSRAMEMVIVLDAYQHSLSVIVISENNGVTTHRTQGDIPRKG